MFTTAAGWLGWKPKTILTTTISQIEMALKGKIDFVRKSNPFGYTPDPEEEFDKIRIESPEIAAKQLLNFVKNRQGETARYGKKLNVKSRRR